jgi:Tfp pilus assembly protein PilN
MVGAACVIAIVGTAHIAILARARAYEDQISALRQDVKQYRAINQMMDSLVRAERSLVERKEKALPLLTRGDSLLPAVGELTTGLPAGTYLDGLAVGVDGRVELNGEARSFKDVSRFVKWVGAVRHYQEVKLTQVSKSTDQGAAGYVTFTVSAVRPTPAGGLGANEPVLEGGSGR